MWTYEQATGKLFDSSGMLSGQGYSGHGEGLNNPAMESHTDLGPIPRGMYDIGISFTHPTKGPCVMRLMSREGTNTFGRSGFLMHGDSVANPGSKTASLGCVIQNHVTRIQVASSKDRILNVV